MKTICPECKKRMRARDEDEGKKARCPDCGSLFLISSVDGFDNPTVPVNSNSNNLGGNLNLNQATSPPAVKNKIKCVNHPDVDAVVRCRACKAPICKTCDFTFPGNLHFCPNCASNPQEGLSSKRKGFVIWSYILAVVATLTLVLIVSGATDMGSNEETFIVAAVLGNVLLLSSLIGMGLGFCALEKRLKNPGSIWGALIWNIVLSVITLILCIIGLMAGF